jgi:hypothetical protein
MGGRFYLSDHQHKGLPYSSALEAAGYERVWHAGEDDLAMAFYDHDCGSRNVGFRNGLSYLHKQGVPVFLYPHAARPFVQYDGISEPWPHTRCTITITPAQAEILKLVGYPCPVEACGWALCEQAPWKAVKQAKRRPLKVLFGPIHPNNNGWLSQEDQRINQAVYKKLLATPGIQLTVRHIKRLDLSGLLEAPGVTYILAEPDGKTTDIDQADVVIGHQTMAFLAAARGKALIMFGDKLPPRSGNSDACFFFVSNYEKYRDILRYPLEVEDAEDGPALREMMERAISEDTGAIWRERLIGEPFDPVKFVEIIQSYL